MKMRNNDCIYSEVCQLDECTDCIRYLEMSALLRESRLPKSLQKIITLYPEDVDYDAFVRLRDIKDNITDHINNGNFNLLLYSKNTGNGKTSWAAKMLLKYFDDIWAGNGLFRRALFLNVPNFLVRSKNFGIIDSDIADIKTLLIDAKVVVWDDIASTKISDYDNTQLLNYIEYRISNNRANIYTANIGGLPLQDVLGNRLYSRIWNNSTRVELRGRDMRGSQDD